MVARINPYKAPLSHLDLAALIALLDDPDYRVGAQAIDTLAQRGDPAAVPALLKVLQDRQLATIGTDVRTGVLAWRAVVALGKLGSAAHIPYLLAAASEEFSLLRAAVVEALTEIALRTDDPESRLVVCRALIAFTQDTGVVSIAMARRVRDVAVRGLSRLGALDTLTSPDDPNVNDPSKPEP